MNRQRKLLLALHLFVIFSAAAQKNALEIGDSLPNLTVNVMLPDGTTKPLSSIKNKMIIFDFWNTKCKSCIKSMPKLDSLQRKYNDQLQIVLVTRDSLEEVNRLFGRIKLGRPKLPMIYGDSILSTLFPYETVPHHVWVDASRRVKFITQEYNTNDEFLGDFLAGKELALERKAAKTFDINRRLMQVSELQNNIQAYSAFYPQLSEIGRSFHGLVADSTQKMTGLRMVNLPLLFFYQVAFNESFSHGPYSSLDRIEFRTKRKDIFLLPERENDLQYWKRNNEFSYESLYPVERFQELFLILRQDLERKFPFKVSVQKKRVEALVLISKRQLIKSSIAKQSVKRDSSGNYRLQNYSPTRIVAWIQANYHNLPFPVINDIKDSVGIDVELKGSVECLEQLNSSLLKAGLALIKKEIELNILVIEDK